MSALDFLSVSTSPAPDPQSAPARSTPTSTASVGSGAFDALVSEKSQSTQQGAQATGGTTDRPKRGSANGSASDDAGDDVWKSKDKDREPDADANDVSGSASGSASGATTSALASFVWMLRHHGGTKHTSRDGEAANAVGASASSRAQAWRIPVLLSNAGAAVDPAAIGAAATAAAGAAAVTGAAAGQVASAAGRNAVAAVGWRLDSSVASFASSAVAVMQGAGGAVSPDSVVMDGATASDTAGQVQGQVQGQVHGQGPTEAHSLDVTLGAAVGTNAAKTVGAAAGTPAQATLPSPSMKANAVTSATLRTFAIDAAAGVVAEATQRASGQPAIGTGIGTVFGRGASATSGLAEARNAAIGTNAGTNTRAGGFAADATGTSSNGLAGDVSVAARRHAWSELARLLGTNQATTVSSAVGPSGASATASSATAIGAASARANAAAQRDSAGAPQASNGWVIVDSLSLASSAAQDKAARAHATATEQANGFVADDRAGAATLAAAAFEGARPQTGHGDSDRSGAFASFDAGLGRGAGDAIATTTTTTFPLHQLTSMAATPTALAEAAHTAAASGTALPAALAAQTDGADAAQQVIRSMRLQWSGSVGEAQLRLQPEHLGQVLVSVRVDQGNVSATLRADSATAHQWIEAHQQDLRQALQDQGLRVTQFHITTNADDRTRRDGSAPQDQPRDQQQPARRRDQRQRQHTDGRRFEVRV